MIRNNVWKMIGILVVFGLLFSGCGKGKDKEPAETEQTGWQTYNSEELTFQYRNDWILKEDPYGISIEYPEYKELYENAIEPWPSIQIYWVDKPEENLRDYLLSGKHIDPSSLQPIFIDEKSGYSYIGTLFSESLIYAVIEEEKLYRIVFSMSGRLNEDQQKFLDSLKFLP